MYFLRLFGTLSLEDPSGAVSSATVQQRPLAVLAILAAARDTGCSRDKLIGYLWPDIEEGRARHRLSDVLYVLRQLLGDDVLIAAGDALRLNPGAIESDLGSFLGALNANELETAAGFYCGPFLDGFFLSGTPEFERWVETERQRLAAAFADALEKLAEQAEAQVNDRTAVDWWRRLAAHDPYNSRYVLRLMSALAAEGDRGNALQVAQDHERRLSDDLGMEPDAELLALAERLRSGAGRADSPVAHTVATPPLADAVASKRAARPRVTWRVWAASGALAVAVVVTVVAVVRGTRSPPTEGDALDPNRVVVLPFTVRGSDELGYLEEGMVDLLATALHGAGELTTVDPYALLGLVRRETEKPLDPENGRAVAARFGAGRYILGDILEAGGRIRATASLYEASSEPQARAQVVVEDEAQILELADELARQLVVAGTDGTSDRLTRLGAATTESLGALKAYLRGEALFRSGWFNPSVAESAVAEYKRAVAADSAFALAYFRMAVLESAVPVSLDVGDATERALRYSDRLAIREQRLLQCFAAFFERGDGEEAERWCRSVLRNDPDNMEAWWWLGDALHHYGLRRGRTIAEIAAAYERANTLDPSHPGVVGHLSWLALVAENKSDWARHQERRVSIQPQHPRALGRQLFVDAWRGDESALDRLFPILESSTPWGCYLASHYTWPMDDRAATIRILELITAPQQSRFWRAFGHVMIAHEQLAAGRLADARGELAEAESLDFEESLKSKVYLLLSPYLPLTADDLEGLRDQVTGWTPAAELDTVWRLYLLGLLHERLGDRTEAEQAASALDARAATLGEDGATRPAALAEDLALYLRARLAAGAGRHEEALSLLQATQPERWWLFMSGRAYEKQLYERWLTADVLAALGRHEEAVHWLAAFGMDGERSYMGSRHFRLAEIYEELGNREKAAYHCSRFIAYWKDADPELQPRVEAARRALEALSPDT